MLTCCIIASVMAIAAISFIGFCIYQGIKSEREKQKSLLDISDIELDNSSKLPDTKLYVDVSSAKELPKNTSMMPD
ncbi:MAG: hypothetical protein ACR5KX_02505 [Wolbachia sp.]